MSVQTSINDVWLKIKYFRISILVLLMFVASNVLSFLIGATYYYENNKGVSAIKMYSTDLTEVTPARSLKIVVASIRGKKYYFPWCKGVENLKESNKIYFSNAQKAERAGYELASSCKVNTR